MILGKGFVLQSSEVRCMERKSGTYSKQIDFGQQNQKGNRQTMER